MINVIGFIDLNIKEINELDKIEINKNTIIFAKKDFLKKIASLNKKNGWNVPKGHLGYEENNKVINVALHRVPFLINDKDNALVKQCMESVYLKGKNDDLVPLRDHQIRTNRGTSGKLYKYWANKTDRKNISIKSKNKILDNNKKFLRYLYCSNANVEITCKLCGLNLESFRLIRKNKVEHHPVMELHHFKYKNQKSVFKSVEPSEILSKSNLGSTKYEQEENILELMMCIPLCNNCHSAIHKSSNSGSIEDYAENQLPWFLSCENNFHVLLDDINSKFSLNLYIDYNEFLHRYC